MIVQMNTEGQTQTPQQGGQMQQGTAQPKPQQPQQQGASQQPGRFSDWAML
jgi:hypothetical protein